MVKNKISTLYKGILIGSTMLVPGVSGASMAIILGVYDQLIDAVSDFLKDSKRNFIFLVFFVAGAGAGMVLLAKPILSLLESYPKVMGFLFIGAVAGGIPAIYAQAQVNGFFVKNILYIIMGMLVVGVMSLVETERFINGVLGGGYTPVFLLLAGGLAAVALILPGISVSYLLLVMGLYQELMYAISELDLTFLLPIGVGLFAGIVLFAKGVKFLMTRYPQISYLTILGFMLGSLIEVFPGLPVGGEWLVSVLAAGVGFYFIFSLSKTEVE